MKQMVKDAILDIVILRPITHNELVSYAEMYGDSVELVLSELVQCGEIKRLEIKYPNNSQYYTFYIHPQATIY